MPTWNAIAAFSEEHIAIMVDHYHSLSLHAACKLKNVRHDLCIKLSC